MKLKINNEIAKNKVTAPQEKSKDRWVGWKGQSSQSYISPIEMLFPSWIKMIECFVRPLCRLPQAFQVWPIRDAEDGAAGRWFVYDNAVSGATILNVFDAERGSRVIQLSGAGYRNGYWLRDAGKRRWQNSNQFVLGWKMKFSAVFSRPSSS